MLPSNKYPTVEKILTTTNNLPTDVSIIRAIRLLYIHPRKMTNEDWDKFQKEKEKIKGDIWGKFQISWDDNTGGLDAGLSLNNNENGDNPEIRISCLINTSSEILTSLPHKILSDFENGCREILEKRGFP